MTKETHERIMEGFNTLKNDGFKAFNEFQQANTKELERKPSRREYYDFKDKCLAYIASEFPVSNALINTADNEVDEKMPNYIMEIGMLVKMCQAGLLNEDMFLKIKKDISRRYKISTSLSL